MPATAPRGFSRSAAEKTRPAAKEPQPHQRSCFSPCDYRAPECLKQTEQAPDGDTDHLDAGSNIQAADNIPVAENGVADPFHEHENRKDRHAEYAKPVQAPQHAFGKESIKGPYADEGIIVHADGKPEHTGVNHQEPRYDFTPVRRVVERIAHDDHVDRFNRQNDHKDRANGLHGPVHSIQKAHHTSHPVKARQRMPSICAIRSS